MVRQATKFLLCILLCNVIGCAKDGPGTAAPCGTPVVRATVYQGKRYLVISTCGRSYAVAADAAPGEEKDPCDCELPVCAPMCGVTRYDAGVEPALDAGSSTP